MSKLVENRGLSRRDLLNAAGIGVIAVAGGILLPRPAEAGVEAATKFLHSKIGAKTPATGRIKLTMPEIAENGNNVPVSVVVESPMTDQDYVKAVHVIAEANPLPETASFYFTPDNGRAKIATRMRLSTTQHVWAVAEMSDGSVFMDKAEVKVTIGGCGG
jgi:sulfur-oxidizing protein SoxY